MALHPAHLLRVSIGVETEVTDGAEEKSEDFALEELGQEAVPEILFVEPMVLKIERGIRAKVPAPSAFLLHKLVIAARSEHRNKKEKDIRQAIYTAKFVLSEESKTSKLLRLWTVLPSK